MNEQELVNQIQNLGLKLAAQASASQFMIKLLLYMHFEQFSNAASRADDFRSKVLAYVEREYADQPEFRRQIDTLLGNLNFQQSSFADLLSDSVS